jgi:hypothetical protein
MTKKSGFYFVSKTIVGKMAKKFALALGCVSVWLYFASCGTLLKNGFKTLPAGDYITPEIYATLGEEQLKKTQFYLSADIKLTRTVSVDTQTDVISGQAAVDQGSDVEVIEITASTPGELIEVSTIDFDDGSKARVLGVCFDNDSNRVLYFIYGTLPYIAGIYSSSRTGYYLIADNLDIREPPPPIARSYHSTEGGSGTILYGNAYYDIVAYQAWDVNETWHIPNTPIENIYRTTDRWPFLRAAVKVNKTKNITSNKATGRVVQ